ncbi:MAG: rhomboid family intramembrane serine protease [Planctomycetota bacterium]
MFILPIRTSIRPWRTPYANYALIVINIIIFFITFGPHRDIISGQPMIVPVRHSMERLMLIPGAWHFWQFLSYAFLHGGLLHIIGNMYFLYLFGNNVNDKLGHAGYICLYLGGAIFAGIGHAILHANPVLGASGAVAAITGAYLALFPQTYITVLYWFFFIGTIELLALYFILFKLIFWDNIVEPAFSPAAVAYDAHIAGYAFGIVAILALLASGLITGSSLDLWAMIKRWNRRRQYRDAVSSGYNPFTGRTKTKQINVKEVQKTPAQQKREEEITQFRNEIAGRISQRNLPAAARAYLDLMELDSEQVLPRQYLLDIANQLTSDNKPSHAAQAYEQFLKHYGSYEYVEQVELMLGILYSRYLQNSELAIKHLQTAANKLTDPGQLKMCQDELAKLQG